MRKQENKNMEQIDINIDKYLSDEEKKELAIQVFKKQIKKELSKGRDGSIQDDSEIRSVIGNITSSVVMREVQKYIPNCEHIIKKKVESYLNDEDLNYYIFKRKDVWESKESLAITYMNETITNCKELFQSRIKESIEKYDFSKEISNQISVLFDEMAGNMFKLSDIFHKQ